MGGQGTITSSIIIAEIETILGSEVVQLQSYTVAVRGGICESVVMISNEFIGDLKIKKTNIIVSLSQEALDKYNDSIDENTLLVVDEDLVKEVTKKCNLKKVPFRELSFENFETGMFANIIMLGYLVRFLENISLELMKNIVVKKVPEITIKENLKALEIGYNFNIPKNIISDLEKEIKIDNQYILGY